MSKSSVDLVSTMSGTATASCPILTSFATAKSGVCKTRSASAPFSLVVPKTTEISERQRRELMVARINEIVGKGLSGILYMWINYLKGWRPRWFVLHHGVLSYHKIHGPRRIYVNPYTIHSQVVGAKSAYFVKTNKHINSFLRPPPPPLGEVHLKVSSIEESTSDDTKFTIFTGTKLLYLRAESYSDRAAWVDTLKTIKRMFPRMELMTSPVANTTKVSTQQLRERLVAEGVNEAAIADSEQIMKNEITVIQNRLLHSR